MIIEGLSKAMDMMPRSRKRSALQLAYRLGWLSIALGFVEIVASRRLARMLGVRRAAPLINLYGMREVATGAAIMAAKNPASLIWARVGGDALDIASLLAAFTFSRRKLSLSLVLTSIAAVAAVDLICAKTLSSDMKRKKSRIPDYSGRSGFPKRDIQDRTVAKQPLRTTGAYPGILG